MRVKHIGRILARLWSIFCIYYVITYCHQGDRELTVVKFLVLMTLVIEGGALIAMILGFISALCMENDDFWNKKLF